MEDVLNTKVGNQIESIKNILENFFNSPELDDSSKIPTIDYSNIKLSQNISVNNDKEEFIQIEDFDLISTISTLESDFKKCLITHNFNDKSDQYKLISLFKNMEINQEGKMGIGPITSIDLMIKNLSIFNENGVGLFENLKAFIFKWRKISGDGNCFYRAVMFSYLENVILEKKLFLLKNLISDAFNKFNPEYENTICLQKELKDKFHYLYNNTNVFKILLLIYQLLEASNDDETLKFVYEILIKSFIFSRDFDVMMVMLIRFKIYEFIKINQTKLYHKDFSVKIGNLLPAQYETEKGEFLFDNYFNEDLLNFGKEAEKIIIYLTPFVLKVNLRIILSDLEESNYIENKDFGCYLPDKFRITLLYRKTHYDVVYDFDTYTKYTNYFSIFTNIYENPQIIETFESNIDKLQNINFDNIGLVENKEKSDLIDITKCFYCQNENINTSDIFSMCSTCLEKEIESLILSKYRFMLKKAHNLCTNQKENLIPFLFEDVFLKNTIEFFGVKVILSQIDTITNKPLKNYISNIKMNYCCFCMENVALKKYLHSNYEITFNLPCGCYLCSNKCSAMYFELILNNINKSNLICPCGYNFSIQDIKTLYEFFEFNGFEHCNNLGKIIDLKMMTTCLSCLENIENKNVDLSAKNKDKYCKLTIFDKDDKIEKNSPKKQNPIHIYCPKCYINKKIKEGDQIDCKICKTPHFVKKNRRKTLKEIFEENEEVCLCF